MCELCAAFQDDRDCGFGLALPLSGSFANVEYEIPGDATSEEVIAVGGVRTDRLEVAGDEDWFGLSLAAGETVTIELASSGADPLVDPHLWLFDAGGGLVAWNDDGGPGLGALIEFTAPQAGTWFVAVDSYGGLYAGDYRLAVEPVFSATDPIPDDPSTAETITVGGACTSRLDYPGDEDWFRLSLAPGQAVLLEVTGTGTDPLYDPLLRIRDFSGALLQEFDDGPGYGSSHRFFAETGGTYFVEVAGYADRQVGDYELAVTETDPPRLVESVLGVNRLATVEPVLVYLAEAGDAYGFEGASYTATGLNDYEAGQIWSILQGIEALIDIDFQPTADRAAADLQLGSADLGASLLGFATMPSTSGTGGHGLLNDSFQGWSDAPGGGLDAGGIMYGIAIHEIGHTLGLGHTHDTGNGTAVMSGVDSAYDLGAFDLNQTVFTAMSYNRGWVTDPDGPPGTYGYGYGGTFGAIDIAALQEIYGANTAANGVDDVYLLTAANAPGTGYTTIWDTGGIDGIRHDGSAPAVIDLRPATLEYGPGGGGFVSRVGGVFGGFTIAAGAVIENATGGAGDDLLTGNDAANTLAGGDGNDRLSAGDGADLLEGGAGDDVLEGGSGADTFRFQAEAGTDLILDFETGIDLIDLLETGASFRELDISNGEQGAIITYPATNSVTTSRIELVGVTADLLSAEAFITVPEVSRIIGFAGPDVLIGTAFDDEIRGLGGDDTLDGGAGADMLDGGPGNDILLGGDGKDRLYGGAGDDWLDVAAGGGSFQYAFGGDGNDTYAFGKASGRLFIGANAEAADTGTADRIVFPDLLLPELTFGIYDYTATSPSHGQALRFLWNDGATSAELRVALEGRHIEAFEFADGSEFDSVMVGGPGDDVLSDGEDAAVLFGGDGKDRLYGGAGDDWLDVAAGGGSFQYAFGGDGNDTYAFGKASGRLFIGANAEAADTGTADRIVFSDLLLSELTFGIYDYTATSPSHGQALRFLWNDGATSAELRVALEGRHIEAFEFADGTVMTAEELLPLF